MKPPFFVQSVFGILGGIGGHPEDVMHMRRTADRLFGDYHWSVLGAGRNQLPIAAQALALGGNMRVGLEDSLWIGPGKLARIERRTGREGAPPDRGTRPRTRNGRRGAGNPAAQGRRQGRVLAGVPRADLRPRRLAQPPKATQFQPGCSGNREGRPKGRPSLNEIILEEGARIAKVKVGEKVLHIDKDRAGPDPCSPRLSRCDGSSVERVVEWLAYMASLAAPTAKEDCRRRCRGRAPHPLLVPDDRVRHSTRDFAVRSPARQT